MSSSRRKSKGSKSRRTKDQILQELEITQRLLIEKEEELVVCQEELAHLIQDGGPSLEEVPANENTGMASDEIEALELEVQRLKDLLSNKSGELAPQLETPKTPLADDLKDSKNSEQVAEQVQEETVTASTTNAATPTLTNTERTTVPIRIAPFADIVQQNQPFTAEISIDMTHIAESKTSGLNCKTKLFAKRLSDGWSGLIGEEETVFSGKELITARVSEIQLSAGLYQLQAVASFTTHEGVPIPIAAIHEGELLEVGCLA